MAKEQKNKSLDDALDQLTKLGITMCKVTDAEKIEPIEVIPTGSLALNLALGIGGYPRGRITELYGQEMSGKSTLTLIAAAMTQCMGGTAVLLDAEHAYDPRLAHNLGVNVEKLLVHQPEDGEQVFDTVRILAENNAVDLVIVDSTAALASRNELDGTMDDNKGGMASQARLMSDGLRRTVGILGKSKVALIFINQVREKPGVRYGDPTTTPGGKSLKFYSSVRLQVTRHAGKDDVFKDDANNLIGCRTSVVVKKNKLAMPYKFCDFDLYFGRGIDPISELVNLAVVSNVATRSGGTYKYEEHKFSGLKHFIDVVRAMPKEEIDKLREKVIDAYPKTGLVQLSESSEDDDSTGA